MTGKGMTVVAQVEQGPIVAVATEDDMSATTTITTVGTTIRVVLDAAHVGATTATLARAAVYLYVIYKIGFSHDEGS
jgi:hypothetical protein